MLCGYFTNISNNLLSLKLCIIERGEILMNQIRFLLIMLMFNSYNISINVEYEFFSLALIFTGSVEQSRNVLQLINVSTIFIHNEEIILLNSLSIDWNSVICKKGRALPPIFPSFKSQNSKLNRQSIYSKLIVRWKIMKFTFIELSETQIIIRNCALRTQKEIPIDSSKIS